MGRYYWSKKEEADNLKRIEIWWLKKYDYLCGYKGGTIKWTHPSGTESSVGILVSTFSEDTYLKINYTQTDRDSGEKKDFDYKIPLVTSSCHFGGDRYWFICPWYKNGQYCGRRVGVLYKSGDYFACRHCYDLTYESRNEYKKYKYYPLFASLDGYTKAEKLDEQIKRRYYAGKPTRKQRNLDKIYSRVGLYNTILRETGEI